MSRSAMHYVMDDLAMIESGDYAWAGILALRHYLALWAEFHRRYGA